MILLLALVLRGMGKTYLAVAAAVDALERQDIHRILLTRPAVEVGEKLIERNVIEVAPLAYECLHSITPLSSLMKARTPLSNR
ncbi:MAG: PhoH family protein [Candidatus Malihini olakiniferum]